MVLDRAIWVPVLKPLENHIHKNSSQFWKAASALFAGGFVTFAILYSTQPLLPNFSDEFAISPALSSLSVSVATAALAFSLLFFASVSDVLGRKSVMGFSILITSCLAIVSSVVSSYEVLLVVRILEGIFLAGLPAIAMAYVNEEFDPDTLGSAMGLYISGTTIGGMSGRIFIGILAEYWSWRNALFTVGLVSLGFSSYFLAALPASRNFHSRHWDIRRHIVILWEAFHRPGLKVIYGLAFLLMGGFVSLYNYISYTLESDDYGLSQEEVAWIFLMYLFGTFSSAWMGKLADVQGRKKVMQWGLLIYVVGVLVTLFPGLIFKLVGLSLATFGFFACHSICSAWIGVLAPMEKAQGSSLYLFFYYSGSSIIGAATGMLWKTWGWNSVAWSVAILVATGFLLLRSLGGEKVEKQI